MNEIKKKRLDTDIDQLEEYIISWNEKLRRLKKERAELDVESGNEGTQFR